MDITIDYINNQIKFKFTNDFYIFTISRVLCDVPCTTDRTSLHQDEGNIFKVNLKKLRLKIPEEQSSILQ